MLLNGSKIHYQCSVFSCLLLEDKVRKKKRIAVCNVLPPLSKERRKQPFFPSFFLVFNPPSKRSKRRDSISLLAVINHSFLGASAY